MNSAFSIMILRFVFLQKFCALCLSRNSLIVLIFLGKKTNLMNVLEAADSLI